MVLRDAKGSVHFGRWELAVKALIVINMIAFTIETMRNLPPLARQILWIIEVASVTIFTAEYLSRLALSRPRHRYAFSFFGIIDLLAILPFYLGLVVDMRSLRALRLLRLFWLLKLLRYSEAAQRFQRAFEIAREEIVVFAATGGVHLYLAAVGIHYFEGEAQPDRFGTVFDSLWWAIVTMTTVGYGDAYPITVGGKIFTFFVLLIGLGFVAVPTGLIVSAMSRARAEESERIVNQQANTHYSAGQPPR